MKKIALIIAFGFSLLAVMSFSSEKVIDSPKIVLKEDGVVVEHNVITEQTQLIQGLRDEVDELYDTTYKLNRLLLKKPHQGDQDVRHTSTEPRATRSRDTHR